jgi:hypothetical protein
MRGARGREERPEIDLGPGERSVYAPVQRERRSARRARVRMRAVVPVPRGDPAPQPDLHRGIARRLDRLVPILDRAAARGAIPPDQLRAQLLALDAGTGELEREIATR